MLTEDGKTVARAAYGRYYLPLSIEFLRRFGPDVPELTRVFQMFEVGPWSAVDTNGDGEIDTAETRNAARQVSGLQPISEEVRTIDQSWTLNVADGVKDQHTDQITLNVEREVARNVSVSAAYIFKHTSDLFANIPINRETGQEWEYERIPFQTSAGQQVSLYSVVQKDYNGDGVTDGDDIAWVQDNNTSRVQNTPTFDGIKPRRDYHGLQFVLNKRYSNRWQALASFLYSSSHGFGASLPAAGHQRRGPDVLGRQLDEHAEPDHQQPRWSVALHAEIRVQAVRVLHDSQGRVRFGAPPAGDTGRPLWKLETYTSHTQFGGPSDGVIDPGGGGQIVAVYRPELSADADLARSASG